MRYLLDVSTLVARLTKDHVHHARVKAWAKDHELAICPITEIGFLRVATQAIGLEMNEARRLLSGWTNQSKPRFVPCDIRALDGVAALDGIHTTDYYLANLAEEHGLRWATLDASSNHPAAFVIPA